MINDYLLTSITAILDKFDTVLNLLNDLITFRTMLSTDYWKAFYFIEKNLIPCFDVPEFVNSTPVDINFCYAVKLMTDIKLLMLSIGAISGTLSTVFVDIYFLRRFLDKDYITNGLSYTGSTHSLMYVYI